MINRWISRPFLSRFAATARILAIAALFGGGCGQSENGFQPSVAPSFADQVAEAKHSFLAGDHELAMEKAERILIADPGQLGALQIVLSVYAARAQFNAAAEVAIQMAIIDQSDPVSHWLLAFDMQLRGKDDTACERVLRAAIAARPDDMRGHRGLAEWLNALGQRIETVEPLLAIERLGGLSHTEMLSLIDLGGPFQLTDYAALIERSEPSLLDLGRARAMLERGLKLKSTSELLERLASAHPRHAAIAAFRGRVLAQSDDAPALTTWLQSLPSGIEKQPEYWFAIGSWLILQDRKREAVRAFAEAIRIDPTDHRSLASLAAVLSQLGETESAKQVQQTRGILGEILRLSTSANADQSIWIAEQLQRLVRPWESLAWYRHGLELNGQLALQQAAIQSRRAQILSWEKAGSAEQMAAARLLRMIGFDANSYPLPVLNATTPALAADGDPKPSSRLQFKDVAADVGLNTTLISGYPADGLEFYLHHANGGGIAAFDYDLDGACDIYLVHSGGDPRVASSSSPNQLYRQVSQRRFLDVSNPTSSADQQFGQGVCVADLNQDGFLDLLIANIGPNSVYLNQGDGTFRSRADLIDDNRDRWTSSLAVGDLNGDSLPDVVEVNYLDDPTIFETPCTEGRQDCTPQRFNAASDRFLVAQPSGHLSATTTLTVAPPTPSYGLGVVMANFDQRGGNDVFISNDGDLNHYWLSVADYKLQESAKVLGCSVGRSGYSQACMGIAAGDYDHNGRLDLLITNFYDEPNNLYLQDSAGLYSDEALKFGIVKVSTPQLGFGSQAADFDHDGWLDVAVLNGHLYNATAAGVPFRMQSQLFQGGPGRLVVQQPEPDDDYWQRQQLGRTLALFDFDHDGGMDLITNHLDQPVAILHNVTQRQNWVQLELVGVASERSAVGAVVTLTAGGKSWTAWRTSGDGYQCSNQPLLHFGIGESMSVEEIKILWPSGGHQAISIPQINHSYLVVEGEQAAMTRDQEFD